MKTKTRINEVDKEIGSKLRARRIIFGMKLNQLGKELNISYQQLYKYEKGQDRLSCSMMKKAAQVLNTPISHFFDDEIVPVKINQKAQEHFRIYNQLSDNNRYAIEQVTRILLNGQEDIPK